MIWYDYNSWLFIIIIRFSFEPCMEIDRWIDDQMKRKENVKSGEVDERKDCIEIRKLID